MGAEKYIKIVFGLLLMALGAYSYTFFLGDLITLIKGGFGLALIGVGLLAILLGATD